MMIAHYDPLNKATIIQPMSKIESIMSKKKPQYPFELVIEKKGVFVMSSETFGEFEAEHALKGSSFKKYLSDGGLNVCQTSTGSYCIRDPYFVERVEQEPADKVERNFSRINIVYNGQMMSFMEIMRMNGFSHARSMTIRARIARGWDPIRAIDEPVKEYAV